MKNKIKIINVGSEMLEEHNNIVKDCEQMLPGMAKITSINVCFHDDSITTVCNYSLNGKEDFQIIIWKGDKQ